MTGRTSSALVVDAVYAAFVEAARNRQSARVKAGLKRAKERGVILGRPPREINPADLLLVSGLSVRKAAQVLGVPRSVLQRRLARSTQ